MSTQGVDGRATGTTHAPGAPPGSWAPAVGRDAVTKDAAGSAVAMPRQDVAPPRLRMLEPVAYLCLAGHGLAVQMVATDRTMSSMVVAIGVLGALALAGLLGWRSRTAATVRLVVVLGLASWLMASGGEGTGYVLLWHFVVAAVYPLVLPPRLSPWVAVVVPAAYLALVPFDAADGPLPVALLRAVALAVIAAFASSAAHAFRAVVWDRDSALATLRTFVGATPVGLGYWDLAMRARWVNGALAELSGNGPDEHVGLPIAEERGLPAAFAVNLHRGGGGGGRHGRRRRAVARRAGLVVELLPGA